MSLEGPEYNRNYRYKESLIGRVKPQGGSQKFGKALRQRSGTKKKGRTTPRGGKEFKFRRIEQRKQQENPEAAAEQRRTNRAADRENGG